MPIYNIENENEGEAFTSVILDTDHAQVRIVFNEVTTHERAECFETLYREIQGWDDDENEITFESLMNSVNAADGNLTSLPINLNTATWINFKELFLLDASLPPGSEMESSMTQTLAQQVAINDAIVVANANPRIYLQSLDDFLQNRVPADREKILRAVKFCIEAYENGATTTCPITTEEFGSEAIMVISARQPQDSHFASTRQFSLNTTFPADLFYHADLLCKNAAMEEDLIRAATTNLLGYGNPFLKFDVHLDRPSISAFKAKYWPAPSASASDKITPANKRHRRL